MMNSNGGSVVEYNFLWRLKELVQIFVECLENMENVVNYSLQHCYLAFFDFGVYFHARLRCGA